MEKFEVFLKEKNNVKILNIQGFLDAHTAPNFESELEKLIRNKNYNIVVNLDGLQYISSAGLGVFMGVIENVRQNGGDIKICCAAPKVFKVFDLLGFPSLYEFFDSEDSAINKFNLKK